MQIRAFCDDDLVPMLALFNASVHVLAAEKYDEAQRAAWAPANVDQHGWRQRLHDLTTLIAEDGGMLGFIVYRFDGYIDLLYVAPHAARKGVASALYRQAETHLREAGVNTLSVEASLIAAPFFARQGFAKREEQIVTRNGIGFQRYLMGKSLSAE